MICTEFSLDGSQAADLYTYVSETEVIQRDGDGETAWVG